MNFLSKPFSKNIKNWQLISAGGARCIQNFVNYFLLFSYFKGFVFQKNDKAQLVHAVKHNGETVTIVEWVAKKLRWKIRLSNGKTGIVEERKLIFLERPDFGKEVTKKPKKK